MAKKKNKGNGGNNNHNNNNGATKENGENNTNNGGKENGESNSNNNNNNNTVLKVSMHCDGCASKIIKHLRSIKGVETVKAESETGKVTVVGKVDPVKVRDNLAEKIKKKVELISPQPKKEKENKNEKETNNEKKNTDEKKTNEKESVTTSVLKMLLHCQGCIDKIGKIVLKTKGVLEMAVDKEKDTVTVKGTMDVKKLVENLQEKLKRKVEVVTPKKAKEGGGGGGGGGEKEGGGGGGGGGGKKKNKGGGGGGGGDGGEGGENSDNMEGGEVKKMEYMMIQQPFGYYEYGNGNVEGYNEQVYQNLLHIHMHTQPPQMFSDENPNACNVM